MFSNQFQSGTRLVLYNATRLSAISLRFICKFESAVSASRRSCSPKHAYACVRGEIELLTQGNALSKIERAAALIPIGRSELITLPAAQIARPRWSPTVGSSIILCDE